MNPNLSKMHKRDPRALTWLKRMLNYSAKEFRTIFSDSGVLILFVVATIAYPLLYSSIYRNETLTGVPVAVVDLCKTNRSRELIRRINATPDLEVIHCFNSLLEAKNSFEERKVHGTILIPSNFSDKIISNKQAEISMYADMSSFMYYRAMVTACNYAVLDFGNQIQISRLGELGVTGAEADLTAKPLLRQEITLYNPGMGFASFLMPAVLVLIIHQTLFFGICMLAGTAREHNRFRSMIPESGRKRDILQLVAGKSLTYLILYSAVTAYILGVIPRIFNLPHIGNPADLLIMGIPFLLATIFFSMTVSVFMRNRETGMVVFLFASLILLFMSGFSWPQSNIGSFWLAVSSLFPSTHGIQAYIKINTMGASLSELKREYTGLWLQAGLYFLTTVAGYFGQMNWLLKNKSIELHHLK